MPTIVFALLPLPVSVSVNGMQAHDLLQRDYKKLTEDHRMIQEMLGQRERLIQEHGLILIHLNQEDEEEGVSVTDDQDSGFTNTTRAAAAAAASASDLQSGRPASSCSSSVHHNLNSVNNNNNNNYDYSNSMSNMLAGPTLISRDIMELLCSFEGCNLEEKLKCMAEEREDLLREIKSLKLDLEEERQQNAMIGSMDRISIPCPSDQSVSASNGHVTGSGMHHHQQQSSPSSSDSEVKKLLHEYKFKLKRAEQEIVLLQGNNSRLETQVSRYKGQCEELERSEEELKIEKRRILRELREYQSKAEDLETQNANLQKRIHKLKENRIAAIITNGPVTPAAASGAVPSPASPAVVLPSSSSSSSTAAYGSN